MRFIVPYNFIAPYNNAARGTESKVAISRRVRLAFTKCFSRGFLERCMAFPLRPLLHQGRDGIEQADRRRQSGMRFLLKVAGGIK